MKPELERWREREGKRGREKVNWRDGGKGEGKEGGRKSIGEMEGKGREKREGESQLERWREREGKRGREKVNSHSNPKSCSCMCTSGSVSLNSKYVVTCINYIHDLAEP